MNKSERIPTATDALKSLGRGHIEHIDTFALMHARLPQQPFLKIVYFSICNA